MLALWSIDFSFYASMMLLNLFLSWPGSRKQEAEADYIGLLMMAEGCYRPEAAMELWNRMEQKGGQAPPQILSTHPSNHNREEKIREWLPKAYEKAESSECYITSSYGKISCFMTTRLLCSNWHSLADQFAATLKGNRW
jgi:metalloendopeptidase OMA1, mitochondrial